MKKAVSKKGKCFKSLILTAALLCTAAQTVFAGELDSNLDNGVIVTPEGTPVETPDNESQAGGVKELPSLAGRNFTCENGSVRIPVILGDYAAEDVTVLLSLSGGNQVFEVVLEDDTAIFSDMDLEGGEYQIEVRFYLISDGSWIGTRGGMTLEVPAEMGSQKWKAEQKTAKFDGSQDITFSFKNGTGSYELQSISELQFFAWQQLQVDDKYYHNISVGSEHFACDMEAGTLTLSKEDLIYGIGESAKIWVQAGKDLKDYPQTGDITINAFALSDSGETVQISSIEVYDPEYGVYGDSAWKIDISSYDLTGEGNADKNTEFNVGSEQITVSEGTGSVIGNNALTYIEKNYAEQLAKLGDDYKVSSKLNLTVQESSAVQQEVKDGFQAKLGSKEIIGQYYDINILADVLQNGQKVAGLENISINKLDQKITINLQIPEALRKSGRTYKILHYNNSNESESKAEELKSEVKDWVISFETDSFSPYALVYSDRTASSGTGKPSFSDKDDNQDNQGGQGNQGDDSNNQPGNGNQGSNQNNSSKDQGSTNNADGQTVTSPKTGDEANIVLFVTMILMASVFVGSVMRKKKAYK